MNRKFSVVLVTILFCVPFLAMAKGGLGVSRTPVTLEEDWPPAAILDMGDLNCPGSELVWEDDMPPYCLDGGRIHLRKTIGWGCYYAESEGEAEPRMTGVGMYIVNGNLDADYTGPVWGRYMIVPTEDPCIPLEWVIPGEYPAALDNPTVYWAGTWRGVRTRVCDGSNCVWYGNLKLVGKGHGGELEGLHFKGHETITTYTPLPMPWELIPGQPMGGGPEGVGLGVVKDSLRQKN